MPWLFDQGFAAAGRDEYREFHVAGQPVCQLAHACFNRDVFLVQAVGFGNEQRQQAGGGLPAQFGVVLHTLPAVAAVFEAHFQDVVARITDLEAAAAVCALHCFVVCKRLHQEFDFGGVCFQTGFVHLVANGI